MKEGKAPKVDDSKKKKRKKDVMHEILKEIAQKERRLSFEALSVVTIVSIYSE